MKNAMGIVFATFFCGFANGASDGFDAVRCGADIPRALIGRTMSNEKVVAIESRHKDLNLKDLGGSEISDRLFLISWQICGDEYALLQDRNVVRDVLKFPRHSRESPGFLGTCQLNGKDVADTIIAVLKNEKGADRLSVAAAWIIDRKRSRFAELRTEGLRCPRNGVLTADGGL